MRFCPQCGQDLSAYLAVASGRPSTTLPAPSATSPAGAPAPYDQTATWRKLAELAGSRRADPPKAEDLVDAAIGELGPVSPPLSTILHLYLDRPVTPQGGTLYRAAMTDGSGSPRPSVAELRAKNYLVVNDKLVLVDDVPVGVGYGVIDYWGGDRQHKRWHLDGPVMINPSRNGNPFFMDDDMVAIGVKWRNTSAMRSALLNLVSSFEEGARGDKQVARVLVLSMIKAP